jgi:enamine deaminase RidA (YjgF/YER057c/UK114 family)
MTVTLIPSAPGMKTPPLSAAARSGNLLFVSGTPGYHADGRIDEGDFAAQFDQAFAVLLEVLLRGGSSMASIIKVNMLLTRPDDLQEMNRRYALVFGAGPYPARTTCLVAALPDPRMLLEIECVAEVEAP